MGFIEDVVCWLDARVSGEIRPSEVDVFEPFGADDVACLGVFEIKRAAAVLAKSMVGIAC